MSSTRVPYRKSRTVGERLTTKIQAYLDTANAFQSAAWFLALTKIWDSVYQFFMLNQNWFFLVSLIFNFLNLVFYSINYAFAANKNAGKTANLVYKASFLLLYVGIIVGAILIGPIAGSILFYASCVIDPLINTIQAFYFAVKCLKAKSPAEKEFFNKKLKNAVKFAVVGGLFAIAMLTLYSVAGLPLLATAIIGIGFTIAAIALAPLIMKGMQKIYRLIKGEPEPAENQQCARENVVENKSGFYRYSLMRKELTTTALVQKIQQLRQVLEWKSKPEEKLSIKHKLFSQRPKRHAKIRALNLLEDLLHKAPQLPDEDQAIKTVQLTDGRKRFDFTYQNKEELEKQLEQHVSKRAYQSFWYDKGRVESLCEQGFEIAFKGAGG